MRLSSHDGFSRRELLVAIGATSIAVALRPRPAWTQGKSGPPEARVEAVTETFFGEQVVDPYRWMENPQDPDWEPFIRGQAAYARQVLDGIPERAALLGRISQLSADAATTVAVQTGGGRIFYEKRPQGADNFKLYLREDLAAEERLLIDPTAMKQDGRHVSLDWWTAAPDGRHIVYGLSPAGSENSVAHIMNIASGEVLPERIDRTQYAFPVWLPDGSGFFFNRLAEGAVLGSTDYYKNSVCWLHRLGSDPRNDLRVLARGQHPDLLVDPIEFPFVFADPSSQYVFAVLFGGVRRENPYYTALRADVLAGRPKWRRVCDVADEVIGAAVRGDDLYLLTTRDAQNGKVLKTSVSAPELMSARTVVPESETAIESINAAKDGLYLQDMTGGYSGLRRLDWNNRLSPITLPFEGAILSLFATTREDGVWLGGASWLMPRSVWRYDPSAGKASDTGLSPPPPIDLTAFEAIRSFATVRDGTKVPLSIIMKKGTKRDGRNPTLVDAYGAYQIVSVPNFSPRAIAFLERGGIVATAHVRGGGEYGKRWWKAGQKLTKPNTWRDLIDCCETLVKEGWTSPAHLAIQGGSAGGITVGRAMTERPDLFAVVISNVGVSNALRAEFSQNGPPNIDEFGSVTQKDGFAGLKAMDALHAVVDGTAYPAALLTHGATDPRVEPWHSAKMTARLQRATSSKKAVLLRVTFDAGHGLGSTRTQLDEERADEYAFVLSRAGALP